MTREKVKQEFITRQPSINECEFCPNKGIRLWKCAELHGCKWAQAMMEIAKILESEPCEDCISRQAVLDLFAEKCDAVRPYHEVWQAVIMLPSVEPERKTGKWKNTIYNRTAMVKCSICGGLDLCHADFCHWCGADMREVQNK